MALKKYQKITLGYVIQDYTLNKKNKYSCTRQLFIAGDEVWYEDDKGNKITIPHILDKEEYYPFEMQQPSETQIPSLNEKLELALSIMKDRQVERYKLGVKLLEKGIKITDMPDDLFMD